MLELNTKKKKQKLVCFRFFSPIPQSAAHNTVWQWASEKYDLFIICNVFAFFASFSAKLFSVEFCSSFALAYFLVILILFASFLRPRKPVKEPFNVLFTCRFLLSYSYFSDHLFFVSNSLFRHIDICYAFIWRGRLRRRWQRRRPRDDGEENNEDGDSDDRNGNSKYSNIDVYVTTWP